MMGTDSDGQTVMIKQFGPKLKFSPAFWKAIETECRTAKSLAEETSHFAHYIETVFEEDYLFVVMEHSSRGSVRDFMDKEHKEGFSEAQVKVYLKQLLAALKQLHKNNFAHCCLRAANLLLAGDGTIKLQDLGPGAMIKWGLAEECDTHPYWMAPEMADISNPIQTSSDIWSIGCLAIELITGNPPFHYLNPDKALIKMATIDTPPIPASIVQVGVRSFLEDCFNFDPKKRPSVDELLRHTWFVGEKSPIDKQIDVALMLAEAERKIDDLILKETMIGNWRLVEKLGKGAYGTVYKAINITDGTMGAIKTFGEVEVSEQEQKAIRKEISILKKMDHPNILKFYEIIMKNGKPNIVMEYAENGAIFDRLRSGKFLSEHETRKITEDILKGIDYLHGKGIIHRDMKALNVLLDGKNVAKLGDFGAALHVGEALSDFVEGSPYWMAPEVFDLELPASAACDIWSLGCTVIEFITGNPPNSELDAMTAMLQIVKEEHPPLPPKISNELASFLLLCFEQDPASRSTAKDLLNHEWIKQKQLDKLEELNTKSALEEPVFGLERMGADSVVGEFSKPQKHLRVALSSEQSQKFLLTRQESLRRKPALKRSGTHGSEEKQAKGMLSSIFGSDKKDLTVNSDSEQDQRKEPLSTKASPTRKISGGESGTFHVRSPSRSPQEDSCIII